MADLVFYYGAMGCSKSANALMLRFQYEERGLHPWLIKPETDTRDDKVDEKGNRISLIGSRIGISHEADVVSKTDDINSMLQHRNTATDIIICDEAQFLVPEQVEQLKDISESLDIPVYCYGLRTDFQTHLFPGSKRLFELASEIKELDSVCECGKNKAIVNARLNSKGEIVRKGSQVMLGGNDNYKSMCWSCWKEKTDK